MADLNWKIEDFRIWLEGHALDVIVGRSDSCESCPIATWRRENDEPISVSADLIVFVREEGGEEVETQEWVESFVNALDERHADETINEDEEFETDYRNEPVTAGECLEVLDQIV